MNNSIQSLTFTNNSQSIRSRPIKNDEVRHDLTDFST